MQTSTAPILSQVHHVKSAAREAALQFLYQCEAERMNHLSESAYSDFCIFLGLRPKVAQRAREILEAVFLNYAAIDDLIRKHSQNWTLERMPAVDRSVLRVTLAEIFLKDTPNFVVLDESVELARRFGTDTSSKFVNGVADSALKEMIS